MEPPLKWLGLNWQRLRGKSGSLAENSAEINADIAAVVLAVLDRRLTVDALGALRNALRLENPDANQDLEHTALAFDANVFLRLSAHQRSEDIVDYLRTSFSGHIVLPGQVVQEFWNNQFQAVESLASGIKKRFDQLKVDVAKIDSGFSEFQDRFSALVDEFHSEYGYVYDDTTVRKTIAIIDLLHEKALVPFAPRELFSSSALARRRTKTPPGFKDDNDGDFFVWADLLVGLLNLKRSGSAFSRVVLVSHDKKVDWLREGTAHPILSAEVKAVCGATLEIWSLDKLAKELLK